MFKTDSGRGKKGEFSVSVCVEMCSRSITVDYFVTVEITYRVSVLYFSTMRRNTVTLTVGCRNNFQFICTASCHTTALRDT